MLNADDKDIQTDFIHHTFSYKIKLNIIIVYEKKYINKLKNNHNFVFGVLPTIKF